MRHLQLFVLALLLALFSQSSAASTGVTKPTGQPGCQTENEISVAFYRHFYLKNYYWVCETQGVPATLAVCPVPSAWLDDLKACVPWSQWYWSPTELPPSEPSPAVA
ncbi:uncharacterized protein [Drosophila tropicalis]|uniref:uncharacterized protein n=1 Tax=Drosophila tropicalis TaxID=46794 RepID=UPI0035ABC246